MKYDTPTRSPVITYDVYVPNMPIYGVRNAGKKVKASTAMITIKPYSIKNDFSVIFVAPFQSF